MSLQYCLTLKKWDSNMRETKFKKTEAGIIPIDWNTGSLSELFEFGNGYTPSKAVGEYWNNGNIPWFRVEDIRSNGNVLNDSLQHITPLAVKGELFPSNSFIISTSATVGEYAYVTVPYLANQRFVCLIKKHDIIDDGYFLSLCQVLGQWCRDNCDQGSSFVSVNMPNFRNHEIPLPPLAEQRKFAKALSDIDGLISSLAKLIEKKQNIKTATMQQLLTGKKRLEGFTEPWVEKEIGKLGKSYSGLTGKSAKDFGHGTAKYITFLNVLNNPKIDTSIFENVDVSEGESQNPVRKGDLLFNTSSETPEEVGICSAMLNNIDRLYLNSFCFGFRPNECVDSLFMSYWFRSSEGRNLMSTLAQGSTRYNLSKENMMKSTILIPKKDEQTAIAKILDLMDNEISALETKKAKYESIKKGMMQELLTGRIRLV